MKSMGHVAYDAFRVECPWLMAWNDLTEEMRQRWCDLAQATARAAETGGPDSDG